MLAVSRKLNKLSHNKNIKDKRFKYNNNNNILQ